MEDKQFEEMLRESWSPEPPEGMRERVLRRSRRELPARSRRPLFGMFRWRPMLAVTAVVLILLMGVSEHQRGQRLTALLDTPPAGEDVPDFNKSLRDHRLQMLTLMASASSQTDMRGDERL